MCNNFLIGTTILGQETWTEFSLSWVGRVSLTTTKEYWEKFVKNRWKWILLQHHRHQRWRSVCKRTSMGTSTGAKFHQILWLVKALTSTWQKIKLLRRETPVVKQISPVVNTNFPHIMPVWKPSSCIFKLWLHHNASNTVGLEDVATIILIYKLKPNWTNKKKSYKKIDTIACKRRRDRKWQHT